MTQVKEAVNSKANGNVAPIAAPVKEQTLAELKALIAENKAKLAAIKEQEKAIREQEKQAKEMEAKAKAEQEAQFFLNPETELQINVRGTNAKLATGSKYKTLVHPELLALVQAILKGEAVSISYTPKA